MRGTVARKIHRAAAQLIKHYGQILPGLPKMRPGMAHRPYRRICRVLKREHNQGVAKW